MTMPILSTTTPAEGAPGHFTTSVPTEGEVATIAAEFRTALSMALGDTIRSRRGRADGPREPAIPLHPTGQGHVETSASPAAASSESWPMPSKDAELLAESLVETVANTTDPRAAIADESPTTPTLIAATSGDEGSATVGRARVANNTDIPDVPAAEPDATTQETSDATAASQGALAPHAWPPLSATAVAPARAVEATHTSSDSRPHVEPRDIAASDVIRTLANASTAILRDRTLLHPEFDTRLGRVLERMESEYGFTVEVVETHRTQQRQDTLFAQGRSTPGPIVTWTRHSNHSDGLAADVTVNGGWSDKAGFERLARVAKEEGLATLWPRDPGHIELPRTSAEPSRRETNPVVPIPYLAPAGVRRPETGDHPAAARVHALPVNATVVGTLPLAETIGGPLPPDMDEVHAMPISGGASGQRVRETRTLPDGTPVSRPGLMLPDEPAVDLVRNLTSRPLAPMEGGPATQGPTAIATVARVAEVAAVALVARVARVPAPGTGAPLANEFEGTKRREQIARHRSADELSTVLSAQVRQGEEQLTPQASEHVHPRVTAPARLAVATSINDRELPLDTSTDRESIIASDVAPELLTERPQPVFTMDRLTEARSERSGADIDAITRTDATERIARALKLQDAQQEVPISSLTLRLDHPEGGEDRIRIDLRGSTIGARLDIADPVAAEHVRLHTNELQQALESHGLEGESIAVRSMARLAEPNHTAAAIAGSEREGLRASNTQGGQSSAQGQTRDQRQSSRGEDLSRDSHQPSSRQQRDARGNRR